MDIYIVQNGDDINSIAEKYGITVDKLIQDNGLIYPFELVIGQALVIAYPKVTHTVEQGDTLQSIAASYHVSIMQLLRNNPNLSGRVLNPGETLIISYNTSRSITTNGYAFPFINRETLIQTLPNLTYLSLFNYSTTELGKIISYQDDTEIIALAKEYDVIPLLMLSTLTQQGEPNIELAYNLLLNAEYQETNINEFIAIIKEKGYRGVNIVFNYLNKDNFTLYQRFVQRIADRLQPEGLLFFITINFFIEKTDSKISFDQIDYSKFSMLTNGLIFLKFVWGTNYGPPSPVTNISDLRELIESVSQNIPSDKTIIGQPILGYDWQLPYIAGKSSARSLTIKSVMDLAYEFDSKIQFDEASQTPYFYYIQVSFGIPTQHIVWFIDARSIDAMNKLILDYTLNGSGIWNVMVYNKQLWTIINSQFDILKKVELGSQFILS